MKRREVIEKGFNKVKQVVDRLLDDHGDEEQEFVRITRSLVIEIDISGGCEVQLYALRDGADMDGCTSGIWDTDSIYEDIRYLLNCWV